jgi:ubiquitin-protein ligase
MENTSIGAALDAAEKRLEVLKKCSNSPALSGTSILHDLISLLAQSSLSEPQQAQVKRILERHTECILNQ